jgi:SEC-C motif-containing protein
MKSRYSAYAVGDARYIMETTHRDNPDYGKDPLKWREEIERFCREESFESLHIVSFEDGEDEAFVTFIARLGSGTMREKSRFVEVGGRWLYIEAVDIGMQRGVNSSSL